MSLRLVKWLFRSWTIFLLVAVTGIQSANVLASNALSPAEAQGAWQSLPPTGFNRQEVSYVELNGKFYLAGGSNVQQVYNPATNLWTTLAPLPATLDHIQGVTFNGLIYYIGGLLSWPSSQVSTVYIYNPASNSFSQGAPMNRGGRGAGGTAVYNGKIYYAGGLNNGTAVNWFDVYDPIANTWTSLPNMPTSRDHFHAAVVNGKFYAIGGRNVAIDATTRVVEAYDFSTNTWSTLNTQLPTARGGFAAAVIGTEILIIGGEGGGHAHSEVEAYDTATNTWRTLTPMINPRHGIEAAVCNGGVYLAAGGLQQAGSQPGQVSDVFFLNGTTTCGSSLPNLAASPASVNFGSVNVGSNASRTITVTNQSTTGTIHVTNLSISGSANFTITAAPSLPATLGPSASLDVTVSFAPTVGSLITGSLNVTHDGGNSPVSVDLAGTGVGGASPTPSAGQSVLSFSLINSSTNQPIAGFDPIASGAVINIPDLPTRQIYFRANTSPATVGSVRFGIDSISNYLIDNSATYDLFVDLSSSTGWVGTHTLTGTPYTGANASGTIGTPLTLSFRLTNNVAPSSPTPIPPTATPRPPTATPRPPTATPPPTLTPPSTLTRPPTTTPVASPSPLPLPAAPTNLTSGTASTSQIDLAWTDNSNNETGFEIQRSTSGSGGPFNALTTTLANVVNYSNTGLTAGTQYCYRVRATNDAGSSAFTNVACSTTTSVVQSVTSITLIDASTGQPIAGYNPIPNNAVISLASLPTRNVIFRANTSPATVGSVRFGIDTVTNYLTDNSSTYDLPANLTGNGLVGNHIFKATPYSGANATGTVGTTYTLNIQFTN